MTVILFLFVLNVDAHVINIFIFISMGISYERLQFNE